ncbi:sulfur carrier protein ThiS [Leeuwenhoekiella aequorea]|uniref:sulfur carrier protein ThiS n=1 Tax=Leeuwenhoekiella aequorea TaxID=283736 RepID=UPI00352FBCA1|tara:strand:- start:219 stop:422 length:204 start_codon:yes stop_codon:yes gene_type:complete
MITVNVNNQSYSFSEEILLSELLHQLNFSKKGIAVAVNNAIVSKERWEDFKVSDEAFILIIKATQGG